MAFRWMRVGRSVVAASLAVPGVMFVADPAEATGPIWPDKILVSVSNTGMLGNGSSSGGVLSADGSYLAFLSGASNLVPGDTNGHSDVFVKHLPTGAIHRVSVGGAGVQGNRPAGGRPSISADGRYVAFSSAASNLVPGDTNSHTDVFVRDRTTRSTVRVSVSTAGVEGNGYSAEPAISGDGQVVAFSTKATNLVPDDTNGRPDIVVRTWSAAAPTTTAVSLTPGGAVGSGSSLDPSVSRDGNLVAFTSFATDLVANDTNGTSDVFVRDVAAATTTLVSTSHTGGPSNGASGGAEISIDGTVVVYDSYAANLVSNDTNNYRDVFMRRLANPQSSRESLDQGIEGDGDSFEPTVSEDGRRVAFSSNATNLTDSNDTD